MSLEVNESTITKDSKVGASEESTEVESKEAEMETSDESSFASKFMSYAKTCDQCQSMRTSRWRRGPSGPKVKNLKTKKEEGKLVLLTNYFCNYICLRLIYTWS